MEPTKIQKIFNWLTPRNLKEVSRFLRFINYNQQFIKKYVKILHFLITLTKKTYHLNGIKNIKKNFHSIQISL